MPILLLLHLLLYFQHVYVGFYHQRHHKIKLVKFLWILSSWEENNSMCDFFHRQDDYMTILNPTVTTLKLHFKLVWVWKLKSIIKLKQRDFIVDWCEESACTLAFSINISGPKNIAITHRSAESSCDCDKNTSSYCLHSTKHRNRADRGRSEV